MRIRWSCCVALAVACALLPCSTSYGVILAEFDFETPASGNTPVTNKGVGPDGRLLEGAVVKDGLLFVDGLGQGLDIPFGVLNPFGGDSDWSLQFDFASEDEGGGPLFSSDSSACPDDCNDDVAAASLNIFLTGEGEVVVDAWFIGAMGEFGPDGPLNDGEMHTIKVDYTAAEGLWEFYIDDLEEPVDDREGDEWLYSRDASGDRTRIGDQSNPDFGFEDIDPGEDGIVATFDNFIIDAPSPPPVTVTVDRDTGDITVKSILAEDLNFNSLTITSDSGSLNGEEWKPIAGRLDAAGNKTLDENDNWLAEPATAEALVEAEVRGDGAVLKEDGEFSVGQVWLRSPLDDVRVELFDVGLGETVRGAVAYAGEEILFGDLNLDGELDGTDWELFVEGFGQSLEDLSGRDAYFLADLNVDGFHDAEDFIEFGIAFDEVNGQGAFAALANVPEPSGLALIGLGGLLLLGRRRRRQTQVQALVVKRGRGAACLMLAAWLLAAPSDARAELLVEYTFQNGTRDGTGNGRDGVLEGGIFGDGDPRVEGGKLVLTGEVGEGMEIPLGDANPFNGSSDWTIDLSFNVGVNEEETGYLLMGSADANDPTNGDNQSMALFLDDEGFVVYDNFFVGEVRLEAYDLRDEQEHQLRVTYAAPEAEDEDGQMFMRLDGDWLGFGEIRPEVPNIEDHVVFLGTSLNEDFPFECFDGGCWIRELEGTMDDVRIYDEAMLPSQLRVEVDRASGDIQLVGGEFLRDVKYYELSSESGALRAGAWDEGSLDAQNVDAEGDAAGQSWDVLTANENRVVEAFLSGSTLFDDETTVTVAGGFHGEDDLELVIVTTDNEIIEIFDISYSGELGNVLDCNTDGSINATDLDCSNQAGITDDLLAELNLLRGDLNGDGTVAFNDFLKLAANFNQAAPYSGGDLDGNGIVEFPDFLALAANFNKTSGQAASVPEPAGLVLLLLGFAVLRPRPRR